MMPPTCGCGSRCKRTQLRRSSHSCSSHTSGVSFLSCQSGSLGLHRCLPAQALAPARAFGPGHASPPHGRGSVSVSQMAGARSSVGLRHHPPAMPGHAVPQSASRMASPALPMHPQCAERSQLLLELWVSECAPCSRCMRTRQRHAGTPSCRCRLEHCRQLRRRSPRSTRQGT